MSRARLSATAVLSLPDWMQIAFGILVIALRWAIALAVLPITLLIFAFCPLTVLGFLTWADDR